MNDRNDASGQNTYALHLTMTELRTLHAYLTDSKMIGRLHWHDEIDQIHKKVAAVVHSSRHPRS